MSVASARSRVPSEERLFSLVLALVATTEGATKGALLSSVYGYADRYRHGDAAASLDRQFERDKEQLRSLGISIETIDAPLEPGNNQLTRYRISKRQLQVPEGLQFTERELMLLRLAALAWSEGSLTAESRRAAMKLESLGAGLDVRRLGVAPMLGMPESAAAPLQRALEAGRSVRFDYVVGGRDAPLTRRVAPLRLHRADGRWHLVAWDLERDAGRVFLLARIASSVTVESTAFDPGLRERADEIVRDLEQHAEQQQAVIRVAEGSVAEARLGARAAAEQEPHLSAASTGVGRVVVVTTLDLHELADEICGYGGDATVIAPAGLRALVVQRLTEIANAHSRSETHHG